MQRDFEELLEFPCVLVARGGAFWPFVVGGRGSPAKLSVDSARPPDRRLAMRRIQLQQAELANGRELHPFVTVLLPI
jgi:hypothetical protein